MIDGVIIDVPAVERHLKRAISNVFTTW
jgi:hypothetical protein